MWKTQANHTIKCGDKSFQRTFKRIATKRIQVIKQINLSLLLRSNETINEYQMKDECKYITMYNLFKFHCITDNIRSQKSLEKKPKWQMKRLQDQLHADLEEPNDHVFFI